MKKEPFDGRLFYAGLIAVLVAVFVWLARNVLVEASLFFLLAAVFAALVYRVVAYSVRAFGVMQWSFLLIYYSLLSVEDDLGLPAAGPWFMGFLVGALAAGISWVGPGAGTELRLKTQRGAKGSVFPGGWRPALITSGSALVLLGLGSAHLAYQSPTVPVAAVLAGAAVAGWALFRFVKSVQGRFLPLFAIPVVFFVLAFIGGATDQPALPLVWTYGALAGILIGGTYWSGPGFGAPRPPFAGQGPRRRRRKRRSKPKQVQPEAQAAGAAQ
ncbi:hypothetical protein [Pseudarthrobacter chlorophenolicus]|nr:hypothetical protein [Pseudarthrobacter chlorophenolicus]